MEPELKDLEHRTSLIIQMIKNNNLTSNILNDYLNAFKLLSIDLKRKLTSLDNTHLHNIYTDDDIELLQLKYNLL